MATSQSYSINDRTTNPNTLLNEVISKLEDYTVKTVSNDIHNFIVNHLDDLRRINPNFTYSPSEVLYSKRDLFNTYYKYIDSKTSYDLREINYDLIQIIEWNTGEVNGNTSIYDLDYPKCHKSVLEMIFKMLLPCKNNVSTIKNIEYAYFLISNNFKYNDWFIRSKSYYFAENTFHNIGRIYKWITSCIKNNINSSEQFDKIFKSKLVYQAGKPNTETFDCPICDLTIHFNTRHHNCACKEFICNDCFGKCNRKCPYCRKMPFNSFITNTILNKINCEITYNNQAISTSFTDIDNLEMIVFFNTDTNLKQFDFIDIKLQSIKEIMDDFVETKIGTNLDDLLTFIIERSDSGNIFDNFSHNFDISRALFEILWNNDNLDLVSRRHLFEYIGVDYNNIYELSEVLISIFDDYSIQDFFHDNYGDCYYSSIEDFQNCWFNSIHSSDFGASYRTRYLSCSEDISHLFNM